MTFLFIMLALVLAVVGSVGTYKALEKSKFKSNMLMDRKEYESLSWAAKEVLKEYVALPEANRPMPNIKRILQALDVKHGGVDEVNSHFERRWTSEDYDWNHCPCYRECTMKDYRNLFDECENVQKALDGQKHALALSGISSALSDVEDLTTRLREERELIDNVTKELTS